MSVKAPKRTLNPHYYTDPEIYQIEMEKLFSQSWQFAGHASVIKEPGEYFTFDIAGESLFSVMGHDRKIRTFYNVCQHRAHRLVQGTGKASLIVCPYHAWVYELTGKLRAGPNINAVEGLEKSTICLTEVCTEIFLGFIFVNLNPNAKPMDSWFPNTRMEIEEFVPHWADLVPLEWVDIPEKCNWKVSIENYSECYHCPINHATFATGVIKPGTYDIQPQGYCLRHTTECQSLDKMAYPIDLSVSHAGDYSSWFLWPMFSFQVYPGNILNTYHWRPIDHENVVVWRGWYSKEGDDIDVIHQLAIQDRETTVEEDIHLVESVQKGLKSRGYKPGPLVIDPKCGVQSEHSIMSLQQWMRDAVDGA